MRNVIISDWEDEVPGVLDHIGCRSRRKGLFCLFLMACFALFTNGKAWAQDPTEITSLSSITASNGHYVITQDIAGGAPGVATFGGTLEAAIDPETNMPFRIKNLTAPLFTTLTGTVKNVVIENVSISGGTNVGAVACTADESARIYNVGILGGSVSGSNYVGGLVGLLDGEARVVNCYSFADIAGGSEKAGIVGYNNYESKYNDLKTMVINCMFYGDIAVAENTMVVPIYGGKIIDNDYNANSGNRLNNYNYFLYEAPFSEGKHISKYNCALAAEERFLVRFEFYRHLLNSTRELAAWYATGNTDQTVMLKWVLDRSIANYPILKIQGKYPSVVNYDPDYTITSDGTKMLRAEVTEPNHGGRIKVDGQDQTLKIYVSNSKTNGGQTWPTGAVVEEQYRPGNEGITLYRTDKDFANYNFNYDKVQLPYYNDVGSGNYTYNKVVTGWKIISMEGGTAGGYTESDYDFPNYNFADRSHKGKDIYTSGTGNSGRIYSQGGYFNVPTGVTSITIEPYWGKAAYLSDANYDRYGYKNNDDLTQIGDGPRYTNNTNCPVLAGEQKVYTTFSNALSSLTGVSGATVYDYAVVLVGNYHHHATLGKQGPELSNGTKPFTIMSIDLNEDNEPDYCLVFRSGKNQQCSPIRYDFITVPGMVMAHKMTSHGDLGIPGNCCPKGWFEITTTGLIKFGQFEHSHPNKTLAPVIFMGGVIDQFVANNTQGSGSNENNNNKTKYMLFGDNVWFKMFSNGTHMDNTAATPHRPISLTGGEYQVLYLSGYFKPNANPCTTTDGGRNAECYIDGGRLGEVAGAGQEKIDGDVKWVIDHADISSFYGGGINSQKPISGDVDITIQNSRVDYYCGGPKFGNMTVAQGNAAAKTVTTEATNCTFGTFFGAGYGGTALVLDPFYNVYEQLNYNEWNVKVNANYKEGTRGYYEEGMGIKVNYNYEFFGGSAGNVHRLYLHYANFSLAQTNDVNSTLTGCTVLGNYYGGGSLGAVAGNATSVLTDCNIMGNVFGGGFSVQIPEVDVRELRTNPGPFIPEPVYNTSTGLYEQGGYPDNVKYKWVHGTTANNSYVLEDNGDTHNIKTAENLDDLGRVRGNVSLSIEGTSTVSGSVFGGGDESPVTGNTFVFIKDRTKVFGNIYGGGNMGNVGGNTKVVVNGQGN